MYARIITENYVEIEVYLNLSSDHSPVLMTVSKTIIGEEKGCKLSNAKTH